MCILTKLFVQCNLLEWANFFLLCDVWCIFEIPSHMQIAHESLEPTTFEVDESISNLDIDYAHRIHNFHVKFRIQVLGLQWPLNWKYHTGWRILYHKHRHLKRGWRMRTDRIHCVSLCKDSSKCIKWMSPEVRARRNCDTISSQVVFRVERKHTKDSLSSNDL